MNAKREGLALLLAGLLLVGFGLYFLIVDRSGGAVAGVLSLFGGAFLIGVATTAFSDNDGGETRDERD